jgi:hypothetical protein
MTIRTIDGKSVTHRGCKATEQGVGLHVTRSGRWVASFLRCAVSGASEDDRVADFMDIFGSVFGEKI